MGFLMREKILTEKLTSSFINNDLINDLCKIIDKDDIKFDQESKMMYSTDASIYHMEPICIIFPKNDEIVKHIITLVHSRREKLEDRNCDDVETVTKIASLKIRFLGNLILAPKKYEQAPPC